MKLAAWPKPGSGATGSSPRTSRDMAATTVGSLATNPVALLRTDPAEMSSASGSSTPSIDTAVRSTAMGLAVAIGAPARNAPTVSGRARRAATSAAKASLWAASGQSPCHNSQTTSRNSASSTKSPMA